MAKYFRNHCMFFLLLTCVINWTQLSLYFLLCRLLQVGMYLLNESQASFPSLNAHAHICSYDKAKLERLDLWLTCGCKRKKKRFFLHNFCFSQRSVKQWKSKHSKWLTLWPSSSSSLSFWHFFSLLQKIIAKQQQQQHLLQSLFGLKMKPRKRNFCRLTLDFPHRWNFSRKQQ